MASLALFALLSAAAPPARAGQVGVDVGNFQFTPAMTATCGQIQQLSR